MNVPPRSIEILIPGMGLLIEPIMFDVVLRKLVLGSTNGLTIAILRE